MAEASSHATQPQGATVQLVIPAGARACHSTPFCADHSTAAVSHHLALSGHSVTRAMRPACTWGQAGQVKQTTPFLRTREFLWQDRPGAGRPARSLFRARSQARRKARCHVLGARHDGRPSVLQSRGLLSRVRGSRGHAFGGDLTNLRRLLWPHLSLPCPVRRRATPPGLTSAAAALNAIRAAVSGWIEGCGGTAGGSWLPSWSLPGSR